MRVLLLVLDVELTGVSAAAQNICDPDWLERASSAEVDSGPAGRRRPQPDLHLGAEPTLASGARTASLPT